MKQMTQITNIEQTKNTMYIKYVSLMLAALAGMVSPLAIAHVTMEQTIASAGAYQKLTFKIGHGCEGSGTHTVKVTLPDSVMSAKPMPKAGWKLSAQVEDLATPYQSHGKTISKDVREVSWSEGLLPDAHYDEFSVQVKLPDTPGKLYFKVTQLCEQGRLDWVEIPKEGQGKKDLKAPAPMLDVEGKQEAGHQH
ncbi:YcnI family protein [Undibacterium sp. RuTC16W]|uniref:YcnI family copper-binding membrane protein n=1 Tax=Undibacterium sp. RuTC16W TaxID=3413048 RepID=UPI003BF3F107